MLSVQKGKVMNWENVSLEQILTLEYGSALPERSRDRSGLNPVVGSNGIVGTHTQSVVAGPGIVVGRKGSAGKVTWIEKDFWPIDTTFYVKPRAQVELRWIMYLLKSLNLERLAIVTGVPGINRNDVYALKVMRPPLSEQRCIVAILDQADALRRKRIEADAKTHRVLTALFYKMFGDPATNPMGWQIAELESVCRRITDGTHQPPPFQSQGIPFLFISNIVEGRLNFETSKYISLETYKQLTERCPVEIGDILYSSVGSYGIAVVVDTNQPFAFQRHIAHIKPDQHRVAPIFIQAMLNTPYVKAQADQRARGIAQKTLNLGEIRQFTIFVPPMELQRKFIEQGAIVRTIESSQRTIDLDGLFQNLLDRALSGDLTAKWRELHMKELLVEMEEQTRLLQQDTALIQSTLP